MMLLTRPRYILTGQHDVTYATLSYMGRVMICFCPHGPYVPIRGKKCVRCGRMFQLMVVAINDQPALKSKGCDLARG